MNTQELRQAIQQRAHEAGLMFQCGSDGSINAEIAIIAEAPGSREVAKGLPLIGGSGSFLWTKLRSVNIRRHEVYVTNVVKRQLQFMDKTEKDTCPATELAHWEGLLEWELSQLPNLKYLLLLGRYAIKAILDADAITSWRSSVLQAKVGDREYTTFCTYNPAYPLRVPMLEPVFEMDIAKFGRLLRGEWRMPVIVPRTNPSPDEAIAWLDRMQDERKPVAVDIETSSGETDCVGFANSGKEGMCINWRTQTSQHYSTADEYRVRMRMQRLLADDQVQFIVQNGAFDGGWLWYKDRLYVHRFWFDTMLAHHLLYPLLPHSLEFMTVQYTDHPYYKDEIAIWKEGGDINTRWVYNVKDCCITWRCASKLMAELRAQGLDRFFFDHVMRAQPHLIGMQVLGVKADKERKQRITEECTYDVQSKFLNFLGLARLATSNPTLEINPRSWPQMRKLLFQDLKLVGRGASVDEINRARMAAHPRTPPVARKMLYAYDTWMEDSKFLGTYAESKIDDDGYFRCEYKQTGTTKAPGRLSSAKTMWGNGLNLQNQPERAKVMFITHGYDDDDPDDPWEFSYYDLAQAEAKVVAFGWRVAKLMENFKLAEHGKGVDVHRLNASTIFAMPYEDVPTFDHYVYRDEKRRNCDDPALEGKPTRRYLGKRCVHGLNYRMMIDRLATVCGISYAQAARAWNAYHRAFPEIQQAWDATIKEFRRTGELWSYMGRRFKVVGKITDEVMDSIIAFRPQSTIGDKVTQTIYQLQEDDRWPRNRDGTMRARVRLNVHDALIAENRRSDGETVRALMREHAETPIIIHGEPVRILADLAVSQPGDDGVHRWSTLTKLKRAA